MGSCLASSSWPWDSCCIGDFNLRLAAVYRQAGSKQLLQAQRSFPHRDLRAVCYLAWSPTLDYKSLCNIHWVKQLVSNGLIKRCSYSWLMDRWIASNSLHGWTMPIFMMMLDRIDPEFNMPIYICCKYISIYIVLPRGMSRVNACCAMYHACIKWDWMDHRFLKPVANFRPFQYCMV